MKTLYIITTNQCNMSCPFCYTQFVPQFTKNTERSCINTKTAIDVINKGYKGEKYDYVIFHGGEPLLYPKEILEILDGTSSQKDTTFSIQTNLAYKQLSQDQIKVLVRLGSYGTSFSVDRFLGKKELEEQFKDNVKFLNTLGLECTLLVTLTEMQIMRQNPWRLLDYVNDLGIQKIVLERPILTNQQYKENRESLENLYADIDSYMLTCAKIFPREYTNLYWLVEKSIEHGITLYNTKCSNETFTLYNNEFKYGCPSLECRNENNSEMLTRCLECEYYRWCGMDCECFNHLCAFPKKTFSYIKSVLEQEKNNTGKSN